MNGSTSGSNEVPRYACKCVSVCVYGGVEGSVSALGGFPLSRGVQGSSWTHLIPTPIHPEGQEQHMAVTQQDHRRDRWESSNAACHRYHPPPFRFLSSSIRFPLHFLALFSPLSCSKASTWPLPHPLLWEQIHTDTCKGIFFKTSRHPGPQLRDVTMTDPQCERAPSKMCKSCSVERGELCHYWR